MDHDFLNRALMDTHPIPGGYLHGRGSGAVKIRLVPGYPDIDSVALHDAPARPAGRRRLLAWLDALVRRR